MEEVFWELFHLHCRMIQILLLPVLPWLKPVGKIFLSVSQSCRRSVSRSCICIASGTCVDNNTEYDHQRTIFRLEIDDFVIGVNVGDSPFIRRNTTVLRIKIGKSSDNGTVNQHVHIPDVGSGFLS